MSTRKSQITKFQICWLTLVLMLVISLAHAADEERVEFDPETGNYVVYYFSHTAPGVLQRVVVVPTTKIDPQVKSQFKLTKSGDVLYSYKIKSTKKSRQPLIGFRYEAENVNPNSQEIPEGWEGAILIDPRDHRYRINWSFSDLKNDGTAGLISGHHQAGFSIESSSLSGVVNAKFNGAAPILGPDPGFPDEGPDPESAVGKQLYSIDEYVFRPVAIPKIPVPDPFDAAAVLTSLRAHVKDDWVAMELLDPVFAAKLDKGFEAAIETAKRGNPEGVRRELKALRHQLKGFGKWDEDDHGESSGKQEHDDTPEDRIKTKDWPHPIAKLAARVLDFDLKYIEKRVKGRLD